MNGISSPNELGLFVGMNCFFFLDELMLL